MPTIGGVNIGWDETAPADTSSAGLGDDHMRSIKTSVRQGLAAEHIWESAGGANTGAHVFGSARPFFGPQSNVSSSGSDGRIMVASDTSRLFGVGSGGTTLYGGPSVILAGSHPGTVPQRHYWADEFGQDTTGSTGSTTITIANSGFSGNPYIQVTSRATLITTGTILFTVYPVDGATFVVSSVNVVGGAFTGNQQFFWRSVGTRVL